jgi:hypothetical protein
MATLLLLQEIQQFIPSTRLAQLTNSDLPANTQALAVAGTMAVTQGSTAVVGTGTNFGSTPPAPACAVGNVIQFSSQPGVNYTIAAINSATSITLATPYTGVTAAAATALCAGINYTVLQVACNYAIVEFTARTDLTWDNTTITDGTATPPVINKCTWAGSLLVLAKLYEATGSEQYEQAIKRAHDACDYVLHTWGDGMWSPPQSDSNLNPTVLPGPFPIFDDSRFGTLIPWGPGPSQGQGGSGIPNDFNGGF